MSDWVESLTLEQALRLARHVCLAEWTDGAREVREFSYRSQRFTLEYRLFTVIEVLRTSSSGLTVSRLSKSAPALVSPIPPESEAPVLAPGTRIRVFDEETLDRRRDAIDESIASGSRVSYRPPREVSAGRVFLLLGDYTIPYGAFCGCAGWGILPPELLTDVRSRLGSES